VTIALTNSNPVQYAGNGSAVTFSYPWKISAATDLIVGFISGGVYTQQTVGFTVSGVGNNGGGAVTFSSAPANGTTVDLRTVTPQVQPTEFANSSAYLPENSTNAMDRVTRALQDLTRLTYTFGIHGPDQETTAWPALPGASGRAGNALVFDANGLPVIGALTSSALTQSQFNSFYSQAPQSTFDNFFAATSQLTFNNFYANTPQSQFNTFYAAAPQSIFNTFLAAAGSATATSGQFTGTVTGLTTTVQGPVNYNITGNICVLYCNFGMFGISNTNSLSLTGLPSIVRPTGTMNVHCFTFNNGDLVSSRATVSPGSSIFFSPAVVSGTAVTYNLSTQYVTSGTKGLDTSWCIAYALS